MRCMLAAILTLAFCTAGYAQSDQGTRPAARTGGGPISQAIQARTGGAGDDDDSLFDNIRKATLADLEYASKLAKAQKPPDELAAGCWDAWADRLRAEQDANLGPEPEPHLITSLQKAMNIRNSLQPESPFMRACVPLVNKLKTDIRKFIGLAITGGAGIGKLLTGIP